ncbi:late embryogenesis abundant protein Lea5-like [Punica granatum]|uniref:Uncharacterized protein n=2 Tax=Punica granatum TaxID=22663 RepID=A0A218WEF4_PUNGR|nr:late embryogenesis abundant protein Lea5-like [Punica granatum]OWM71217.1 hypothetical protein CDL15_Pgr011344 [Punica granatum]PKI65070.1 hypothetical protein CRG98_014539 [Punica granatum]
MARSVSTATLLAVSVADSLSAAVFRRGYAVAAHGTASSAGFARGGSSAGIMGPIEGRAAAAMRENSGAASTWAPDPVTGYYRPANSAAEIDAAELRAMLLNQKK